MQEALPSPSFSPALGAGLKALFRRPPSFLSSHQDVREKKILFGAGIVPRCYRGKKRIKYLPLYLKNKS